MDMFFWMGQRLKWAFSLILRLLYHPQPPLQMGNCIQLLQCMSANGCVSVVTVMVNYTAHAEKTTFNILEGYRLNFIEGVNRKIKFFHCLFG